MKVFVRTKSEDFVQQVVSMHTRSHAVKSISDEHVIIADLAQDELDTLRGSDKFEVFDDFRFDPAHSPPPSVEWWRRTGVGAPASPALAAPPPWRTKTQADVMADNGAARAWATATGEGVTIAIVDTGVDGAMKDFPQRSPESYSPSFNTAWEDAVGHGTMCAAIACGSSEVGGRYNGVAPSATLLSARTTLYGSDLYLIYQRLLARKRAGNFTGGLVVSNSYGMYTCKSPGVPENHPFLELVRLCVQDGIVFVFAAGNNHAFGLCGFPEKDENPNTIWSVNSIDEVITVGTVDWTRSNQRPGSEHANSSRGPGEWSVRKDKPDLVAPTYGEVAWGGTYQPMEWWGTSGACPQVAGLAALLLSHKPGLTPAQIQQIVRSSAKPLNAPAACVGAGLLDCEAALHLV
jgi:subtilisin family serine protease